MRQFIAIIATSFALCQAAIGEALFTHSDDPEARIKLVYKSPPDSFYTAIKRHVNPKQDDDIIQVLIRFLQQHDLIDKISFVKVIHGDDLMFIGKQADLNRLEKLFDEIGAKH